MVFIVNCEFVLATPGRAAGRYPEISLRLDDGLDVSSALGRGGCVLGKADRGERGKTDNQSRPGALEDHVVSSAAGSMSARV
jgi:hypothetical protein